MPEEEKITFNIDKEKNFSEWYTEIVKYAELADLRYNIKGFVVYRPWSVLVMEEMYKIYEKALQKKGHLPLFFPSVIPESNLKREKEHIEGFVPEVFWVTEHGAGEKFEERLALRPTSETAFYQMYSQWIRSYNDLPLKAYQRANVFRCEGKATRPFIRSREFYWIESHDAFATLEEAEAQVKEDMQTTEEVMHKEFGIPFIFFQRPEWDKFAGAVNTYAADVLMPDGKVIQQPSTHLLGQNFSKPFDVKFKNQDGKERFVYITCYGPAISRIFASLISIHGDNNGLIFPFKIAPLQVIIVPILIKGKEKAVIKKAKELKKILEDKFRVDIDLSEKSMGNKFYYWEMKGVPLRIELGPKELNKNSVLLFKRDTKNKELVKMNKLIETIEKVGNQLTLNLIKKADAKFKEAVIDVKKLEELKELKGKIARVSFCHIDPKGEKCAAVIEKETLSQVRGIRVGKKEKPTGKCIVCGKKANEIVYIAKSY